MDLIIGLIVLFIQSPLYLCQTRNALCNTNDYYQERESDQLRDVPMRRQYVISDKNKEFDQYSDFQNLNSYINYPDNDYSFQVVDEDDYYNDDHPYIMDKKNKRLQNIPPYFIEPEYSRKINSKQTNAILSHDTRYLHNRKPKNNYPRSKPIIIITSPKSHSSILLPDTKYFNSKINQSYLKNLGQTASDLDKRIGIENQNYSLREVKIPLRGGRHSSHRRNSNNNIDVNTNSNSNSNSNLQHFPEDISLPTFQLIDDFINQENNAEKPQLPTDSVSLLEILNKSRRSHRRSSDNNNVNINSNTNSENNYLLSRRSLDQNENENVNVNVNSNSGDSSGDDLAISPVVIVNARKNSKLLGSNYRRNIDAQGFENENSNVNTNHKNAGLVDTRKQILPPLSPNRKDPHIIIESPRKSSNEPNDNKNENKNVNINVNEIDSQEY